MVINDPSCNTDQGLDHLCEYLGIKLLCVMKVNGGESLF